MEINYTIFYYFVLLSYKFDFNQKYDVYIYYW